MEIRGVNKSRKLLGTRPRYSFWCYAFDAKDQSCLSSWISVYIFYIRTGLFQFCFTRLFRACIYKYIYKFIGFFLKNSNLHLCIFSLCFAVCACFCFSHESFPETSLWKIVRIFIISMDTMKLFDRCLRNIQLCITRHAYIESCKNEKIIAERNEN